MLKINLSDGEPKKKKSDSEQIVDKPDVLSEIYDNSQVMEVEKEKKNIKSSNSKKTNKGFLIILLVILLGTAGYFEKDLILRYLSDFTKFTKKSVPEKVPEPVQPQKKEITQAQAKLDSTSSHFDPVFDSLREITNEMPEKIWLSSIEINYDGSFTVKATSFSYKTIADFIKSLENISAVTSKKIPPLSKSAEAVYNFTVTGKITYPEIPDILDTVSSDSLASYSSSVALSGKELGVNLTRLPKAGVSYKDADLPFVLDGEIINIERAVAGIISGRRNLLIYRFFVQGLPGMPYTKVRASFSLRSVPAL